MKIERDGKEIILKGTAITPVVEGVELQAMDLPKTDSRVSLRKAWMFN